MSEPKKQHIKGPDVDIIQRTIGNFGRWQFLISVLMALLKFPIVWFQMNIVFLAPPTQFWCEDQPLTDNLTSTFPMKSEGLNTGYCSFTDSQNHTVPCTAYTYNTTIYHSSIVTEWDLVCDNKRLIDITQITIMLGVLLGNIFFGVFADRHGRKKTLLICIILQTIFGLAVSQIPWFWGFVLARFLLGIVNGGITVTSFVMCMEVVGGKWRAIVPILYQIPYGIGNSIMAALAYYFRDWRDLHMVLSVLASFYILYLWLVPESPRWLIATNRKEAAIAILKKAASCNGLDRSSVELEVRNAKSMRDSNPKMSLRLLFSTKEMRKRTILLCLNWFIAGIGFYAFSQYLGKVGENLYVMSVISGFVALPGTILCVFVIRRFGRRWTIAFSTVFTAVSFFGILAIPLGVYRHDWPRVVFAGLGVIGFSVSMPAFYLFAGELFPTTVRNGGVGLCVMCARLGSMFAPLVIAMQDISPILPLLVLGIGGIFEAMLVMPLPETKGMPLPDSVEDLNSNQFDGDDRDENENTCDESMIPLQKVNTVQVNAA